MTKLLDIEVDPQVLADARAGRPEAQARIYLAFAGSTYALIRRIVPRKAVADDLLQDSFVEILQSLDQFRGAAPLGAWIRSITVSKCLMYLRSPWHRSLLWLDAQAGEEGTPGPAMEAFAATAVDYDAQLDLEAALARLPAMARAVVWLYDVEGYTHEEIAAAFERSVSFSKSQLMRAHLRLRELLATKAGDPACTPVSSNY